MESIEIGLCRLELGINGIKHLPNLNKEISLEGRSEVARLGMLEEEVRTHPNQPVLRLREDRSEHDLGDAGGPDKYFDAMESLRDHDGEGAESITPTASDTSVLQGRSSLHFLRKHTIKASGRDVVRRARSSSSPSAAAQTRYRRWRSTPRLSTACSSHRSTDTAKTHKDHAASCRG
ncbi:hypothetical protein EJB05_40806, partial [Eragrostis curvula]